MNDMGNNNFLIVLISNKCTNYFMKTNQQTIKKSYLSEKFSK